MSNECCAEATALCSAADSCSRTRRSESWSSTSSKARKTRALYAGDLRLVGVARLVRQRVPLARIKQQLRRLRAQAPQRTRPLNPRAPVRAFKAARPAQADGWIERAYRNADLRIGSRRAPLGGGNIRPALQQLRWHAQRNVGQLQDSAAKREC